MAKKGSEIERADERVAILKAIVGEERKRAENGPLNERNVALGITFSNQSKAEAQTRIAEVFDELELLLDHLSIAHMAASFEMEALSRLGTAIGDARSAIETDRKKRDPWPTKLVRTTKSFEGLYDIEEVLSLSAEASDTFKKLRYIRNRFAHGLRLQSVPEIDSNQAKSTLMEALGRLR